MNRLTELDISGGTAGGISTFAGGSSQQMTFEYEANSLLKRQVSSSSANTTFSYNGYDLTGVNIGGGASSQQFSYEYDNNKNIINRTQNGAADQFTYDSLSRIESEQSEGKDKTFTYDDQGNRLNVAGGQISGMKNAEYTFDSLDRLTGVKGEGIDVTYSYNGDGLLYERVAKSERVRYYYDEQGKLLAEAKVEAGNIAQMTYFYIYDLNGRLWARQSKTGDMEYYQFNGHGDVVGLTDSTGNELNTYSYDIWGNPIDEEEDVPNVFRYSGEYWDSDTGLQYLRARWYDPNAARFVSRDTYEGQISNPLSLNLYSYVENNPLTRTDPTGHDWKDKLSGFLNGVSDDLTFGLWTYAWDKVYKDRDADYHKGYNAYIKYFTPQTKEEELALIALMQSRGISSSKKSATKGSVRKTSQTFGQPIETVYQGKKVKLRVDAEPDGNKIQIQAGKGKDSTVDIRINPKLPLEGQIPRNLKKSLSEGQYKDLLKNLKKAVDYLK